MIAMAEVMVPPAPRPWSARKAMSCNMFCDKPDNAEPSKKMPIASWKMRRRPYRSPSLP